MRNLAGGGLVVVSVISHVIPLCVFQILNLCCWDCNVFGLSPKVTEGNYVRNLCGVVSVSRLEASPGLEAVHRHRRGYLRIPGGLPFHAGGAWSAVVASPNSASCSVQDSPCSVLC